MGADGTTYSVDGIDDKWNTSTGRSGKGVTRSISNNDKQGNPHTLYKFKSTCVDDMSSAWTESYGDASLGDYVVGRTIRMNGFASNADGFANSKCPGGVGPCTGYTDTTGDRSMGYYDQTFLNYYYYMASQFALSDRWFSPVSSKSIPNRIATFTGGTTQGITQDPALMTNCLNSDQKRSSSNSTLQRCLGRSITPPSMASAIRKNASRQE